MQKWLAGRDVIVAVGTEPAGSGLRSPPTAHGRRARRRTGPHPAEVPRTHRPTLIPAPEEYP
ncbi:MULTISPECIES: hypothetical protein [unclassified Streptomyces]|uniref:hypothetical protein n=1 Tax=unclassified Streptomyces TaxID=2593676 RepID=UPI0038003803|nr:hypothetical protein OG199_08525 [Streptomyces sp. NBC_01176]